MKKREKTRIFEVEYSDLKQLKTPVGTPWKFEYHNSQFKQPYNEFAGVLVSKYNPNHDHKLTFTFIAEDDFKAIYKITQDGWGFYDNATLTVYNDKEKDSFENYYSTMFVDTREKDSRPRTAAEKEAILKAYEKRMADLEEAEKETPTPSEEEVSRVKEYAAYMKHRAAVVRAERDAL